MTPSSTDRIGGWLRPALFVFALLGAGLAGAQQDWKVQNVDRFVAVSDIHGAYEAFETIIRKAGIVDASLAWSGGKDHLIIVGDVLDRGPESRRALDLIMRLEDEAAAAGGAVHLVLGNHELMNLVGDLRYVSEAEYAAFAADETAEMRAAELRRIPVPAGLDEELARTQLEQSIPAGYFAHREAFSPSGRYGAWLLQQPFLVAVNDWAFAHGGLAEVSLNLYPEEFNDSLGEQLRSYTIAVDALTRAGILSTTHAFYDHPALLAAFAEQLSAESLEWPDGLDVAANIVMDLNRALVFEPESPAWYRGNVGCNSLIEADRLTAALRMMGVEHLVVGHTPSQDANVRRRFSELLYRIDTGMLSEYYGGRSAALIVEGTRVSVVYEDSEAPEEVTEQPREVGRRPAGMTQASLAEFLETAEIVSDTELDSRWRSVRLRQGDLQLDAIFTPHSSKNRKHDLAAYRLDLMLGLDMVPVTVERSIAGKPGALQYAPPGVITEQDRQQNRGGGSAWCPLGDQFEAMYVFDSLIGNTGRTPDRIRYSADNYQLLLVGHDLSFTASGEKPEHLRALSLVLSPRWIERLRSLDETTVAENFGELLDRRQQRALLSRRDRILSDAGIPE